MFKKENGITLVALVVTIIILLILAGVTLSIALQDGGLINMSKDAVQDYKDSELVEKTELQNMTDQLNALIQELKS